MSDLLPNVTRANLSSSKEARAIWATQHSLRYLQIKQGELTPEDSAIEKIAAVMRLLVGWFDAAPDMLSDVTGSIDEIESQVQMFDDMRATLAKRLANALQDEASKAGYGRDVVFVDEFGEEVDPLMGMPNRADVHLFSPSVFVDDVPAYTEYLTSRVYGNPFSILAHAIALALKPPERITVDESARRHMKIDVPGGIRKNYDPEITPMMVEPMRATTRRDVEAVTFAGPAQSGKTAALVDGKVIHCIATEPTDVMVVQPSQASASDYATRRVERMIENDPVLKSLDVSGTSKLTRNFIAGNRVDVTWPSINTLAGKAVPCMIITDFDRMATDLGGEGSPYDMARKRTTTFLTRGMMIAESSPGFEIDPDADEPTGHAAPSTPGILGLFNQGSRARWYTDCRECRGTFEMANRYLVWPKPEDVGGIDAAAEKAALVCPHCGVLYTNADKHMLNARAFKLAGWLHEEPNNPHKSFWQQGVSARWSNWPGLVRARLRAERHAAETGDYSKLKAVINIDFGEAFLQPQREISFETATQLKDSAIAAGTRDLAQREVPPQAGVIVTQVDVQKRRFVVQVHAFGFGGESWVIDRFNITRSTRVGEDGKPLQIAPGAYSEDWAVLDSLHDREYKRADTGEIGKTSLVTIDSGGIDATTANAYTYWRTRQRREIGSRIALLKGYTAKREQRTAPPRVQRTVADTGGGRRGGVPLWITNTNQLKDEVHAYFNRHEPGPNTIHLPKWAGEWWYNELAAEERLPEGWKKIKEKANNEAFDLLYAARVAYIILGGEKGKLDSLMPKPEGWTETATANAAPEDSEEIDFTALGRAARG